MGSTQSTPSPKKPSHQEDSDNQDSLPVPPVITRLRKTLTLTATSNNRTSSFIHGSFGEQLKKTSGFISRKNNPFCPVLVEESKGKNSDEKKKLEREEEEKWVSCCLVSPVMAIGSPEGLVDQKGKLNVKARVQVVNKKNELIEIGIKAIHVIEDNAICLMVLQRPIIEIGWSGITCLTHQDQLTNEPYRIINHPKLQLSPTTPTYHQSLTKAFYKSQGDYIGSYKTMPGSLIIKTIDRKPYVVGIQVTEKEGHFVNKEILEMLGEVGRRVVTGKGERQVLRGVDLQGLEVMEMEINRG